MTTQGVRTTWIVCMCKHTGRVRALHVFFYCSDLILHHFVGVASSCIGLWPRPWEWASTGMGMAMSMIKCTHRWCRAVKKEAWCLRMRGAYHQTREHAKNAVKKRGTLAWRRVYINSVWLRVMRLALSHWRCCRVLHPRRSWHMCAQS